jgi:ATP-dependent RNA helicase RhlE
LAIQVGECFSDYAQYTNLRHAVIFGSVNQNPQVGKLKNGIDILVATPGRLLDLINQRFISLNHITHFVLDEADRMLDMGFIHDIKRLLPLLPVRKQTLFFSATMPESITNLSKSMLYKPVKVEVAPVSSVVDTIKQHLYFVDKQQKSELLVSLLNEDQNKSVLVFSRTKHGADKISRILNRKGIDCESIHGNKTQGARQRALSNFKSGATRVIVATDIAARGIDIVNLELVINYDLPDVAETYVHRIGRTGRAGNRGTALSFCSQDEHMIVRDIQKLTGQKLNSTLIQG